MGRWRRRCKEVGKASSPFLEKKDQKTFVPGGSIEVAAALIWGWLDRGAARQHGQKFFGPFLQKRTACFLALLTTCYTANAQPLIGTQDAGTYAIAGSHDEPQAGTVSGVIEKGGVPHMLERGTHICASLHTSFGAEFIFSDQAGIDALPVEVTILHPPMLDESGVPQDADSFATALSAGQLHYLGWTFADPKRLLGGRWTVAVSHGGVRLAAQDFDIDFSCGVPVS